jgi:hypothetical protein
LDAAQRSGCKTKGEGGRGVCQGRGSKREGADCEAARLLSQSKPPGALLQSEREEQGERERDRTRERARERGELPNTQTSEDEYGAETAERAEGGVGWEERGDETAEHEDSTRLIREGRAKAERKRESGRVRMSERVQTESVARNQPIRRGEGR